MKKLWVEKWKSDFKKFWSASLVYFAMALSLVVAFPVWLCGYLFELVTNSFQNGRDAVDELTQARDKMEQKEND